MVSVSFSEFIIIFKVLLSLRACVTAGLHRGADSRGCGWGRARVTEAHAVKHRCAWSEWGTAEVGRQGDGYRGNQSPTVATVVCKTDDVG